MARNCYSCKKQQRCSLCKKVGDMKALIDPELEFCKFYEKRVKKFFFPPQKKN